MLMTIIIKLGLLITERTIMETRDVVIKIMITIIMTWMTDRMTDWKGKKLWLEQEIGQA